MKNKKKYIILAIAIVIGLSVIASVYFKGQNKIEVEKSEVKLGSIAKTIEETGTVYSKRVNSFYSDMSQTVKTLNVSIGDKVNKGDIILSYDNNYDLEIERAKKQIEAITASYNEASKGADFQEISNEKLSINTIENNLEFAKNNFDKIKSLYENSVVSKVDYDEAENNVLVLENQLQEAKNNYALLLKGVSSNIKNKYEAQIEEIMVQIKILEKSKEQSSIIAEFDGIITELNVHQGGMTQSGVVVVEMQDENNLGVYVELLSDEAMEASNGMKMVIKYQNSEEQIDELKIDRIYPKALSTVSELGVEQKRIRVEADIDNNKNNLKIGTEVDSVIILEKKDNVILVEKDAVYEMSGKKYVTVLNGNQPEEREITTGIKDDKYFEVLSGLTESEILSME
ncbi:HlyD family secretion protein [Sedimentibacter acidaminivorans]|uniref:HlyD family secretion protein n=1 Tax=Sedimentibacter acidaminivorans TaxID=913099 RepID=A0ABS4GEY3_9FIRM|nr:HlyD family efflux transporter periplasmic adaptor subunit [Sedimentibacter acidaminivorans]MBP1925920.1 HlyD family secretion protein [Sedimentibacter acidaminivorans]